MMGFDYNPVTFPGPALPESCYRALHSYVLDAVFHFSDAQRADVVQACEGFPYFDRFMLAVFTGRLTVDVVPDKATGIPWLWVHYPRHDRLMAWPIVPVASTNIGADPALLAVELDLRIQGTLDAIAATEEADS